MVKTRGGNSLKRSRNPLLSEALAQKRLDKSTSLLNVLKNHGTQILIIFDNKTFTVLSRLNHEAWRRSIELEDDASDLVSTALQANRCRLKRSFGGRSCPMGQEEHIEIRLRLPTLNRTVRRHTPTMQD